MIEINSSKYSSEKRVLVDGDKEWIIKVPGAREELALSQLMRRYKFLEKKIDTPEATSEDLDKLEDLESKIYDIYFSLFSDANGDDTKVKSWLDSMPFAVMEQFLKEVKEQSEEKDAAKELPQS